MLKIQATCIIATLAVLLTSCESLDKTLNSADSALKAVNTGTVKGLAQIASADDPNAALKQAAKQRGEQYKDNPEALIADIRAAKRDFEKLMSFLTGHVGKTWGEKEVKVPTQTQYVKYTQNYKSRAVVDFDKGEIMVETLDDRDANGSLRNAIITTLLTPDDPRSVDLFSDQAVTLSNEKQPYLKGLVLDSSNKPITTPEAAEKFAQNLIATQVQTRAINVDGKANTSTYVKFAMVINFSNKQAQKYSDVVKRFATQYNISQTLVYAIIRTESNFNPYAVSSAPAYGLMQLVPTSGGRDAYRKVKGQDQAPSKEYLFDPANNIELGTAYLNVLSYNQLESVQNEVSREYCVIAAYNTGSGNVMKAFSPDRRAAVDAINSAQPAAVYDKLRTNLPYAETRDYLQKVVGFRKQFVNLAE
jgi:membrane-bound lytic murein transglycosylase C